MRIEYYASSLGAPQTQFGLDILFLIYNKSLFRNEADHQSWVNITYDFRGPHRKCLGTVFISFSWISNASLNYVGVLRL